MMPCLPQTETSDGLMGILHWPHPSGKKAHCLMRFAFSGGKPVVILSDLRSTPQGTSFLSNVAPAANAAYQVIVDRVGHPTDIIWITHVGPFSTFDTLWSAEVESFQQIHLSWNGREFLEAGDFSDYERIPYGHPLPVSLELLPIELVMQQLNWVNWRDD